MMESDLERSVARSEGGPGPEPIHDIVRPLAHSHSLEHLHYVKNEYLLIVEHAHGWLGDSQQSGTVEQFFDHIEACQKDAINVFPTPEERVPTGYEPVRLTLPEGSDYEQITLFPVRWKEGKNTAERLQDFYLYLVGNGNELDISDKNGSAVLKCAAPNWHCGASGHSGIGTHGPALPPRAPQAHTKILTFNSGLQTESESVRQSADHPVEVFILDTAPSICRIVEAWRSWRPMQYKKILVPQNETASITLNAPEYQAEQATYIYFSPGNIIEADHPPVLRDPTVDEKRMRTQGPDIPGPDNYEPWDMSDHGLFIAGIVHDLAPEAKISVIEVLNEYGVGTFLSIAKGFSEVSRLRQQDHKTIVNCSFVFSFPTEDQKLYTKVPGHPLAKLYERATQLAARTDIVQASRTAGSGTALSPIEKLAQDSVDILTKIISCVQTGGGETVIVACAGNDSERPNRAQPVRFPAALCDPLYLEDNVIAVGALKDKSGSIDLAWYSNDIPNSGLLAFSGEYNSGSGEGIVSVYTNKRYAKANLAMSVPAELNTTGLAEWAGTSFATPIVTAKLAELCRNSAESPKAMLAQLRQATATRTPIGKVDVYDR